MSPLFIVLKRGVRLSGPACRIEFCCTLVALVQFSMNYFTFLSENNNLGDVNDAIGLCYTYSLRNRFENVKMAKLKFNGRIRKVWSYKCKWIQVKIITFSHYESWVQSHTRTVPFLSHSMDIINIISIVGHNIRFVLISYNFAIFFFCICDTMAASVKTLQIAYFQTYNNLLRPLRPV